MSTPKTRLARLYKVLDKKLLFYEKPEIWLLLKQFIAFFELKKRHDNTGGKWKRAWYKLIGAPLLLDGYIRDLRVNRLIGTRLFDEAPKKKFETFTDRLQRIKANPDEYSAEHVALAVQICEVLNDYDEGHC